MEFNNAFNTLLLLLSRFIHVRLCNPIDGSPPGSSIPGILQARTLQWVAISFSNACTHAKSLQSCLTLCNPMDCNLPGSSIHGIFQARVKEWGAFEFCAWRCEPRQIRRTACMKLTGRFLIRTWHLTRLHNGWSHSGHVPMPPVLFENHKLLGLEFPWVEEPLDSLWGSQLEGKAHLAWLCGSLYVTSLLMGIFSLLSLDCILCYNKS